MKSWKSHEKNEAKNIRPLVFSFSPINLAFWYFFLCFFMWFARFQILISELQSIWHSILVLSWLYLESQILWLHAIFFVFHSNEDKKFSFLVKLCKQFFCPIALCWTLWVNCWRMFASNSVETKRRQMSLWLPKKGIVYSDHLSTIA